jgi:hypothetical protein
LLKDITCAAGIGHHHDFPAMLRHQGLDAATGASRQPQLAVISQTIPVIRLQDVSAVCTDKAAHIHGQSV